MPQPQLEMPPEVFATERRFEDIDGFENDEEDDELGADECNELGMEEVGDDLDASGLQPPEAPEEPIIREFDARRAINLRILQQMDSDTYAHERLIRDVLRAWQVQWQTVAGAFKERYIVQRALHRALHRAAPAQNRDDHEGEDLAAGSEGCAGRAHRTIRRGGR